MKYRNLFIAFMVLFFLQKYMQSQYLIESELVSITPASQAGLWDSVPNIYDVANYKLIYNTIDVHGDSTIASGLLSIPQDIECDQLPMLVYCHGTVLRKFNIPSSMNFEGRWNQNYASAGFIAVAPDYLGFGESPGLHPYHHADSEATATIDMIHAAREFLDAYDVQDNGEVYVTGYSQGGHATMAVLQYAHENNLTEQLGIVAGAPMSGAYDQSGTTAPIIIYEQAAYAYMGYAAFTLMAYEMVYGNMYVELSDLFQTPYDQMMPIWFDGEQNEYSMGYVNSALPNLISELVEDSVLTSVQQNPDHHWWQNLQDNDVYMWVPEVPLRLLYCQADDQVPYQNSLVAQDYMLENGAEDVLALDVLSTGDHFQCRHPAIAASYNFFTEMANMCWVTSTESYDRVQAQMYPNPAASHIRIYLPDGQARLILYNVNGMKVMDMEVQGKTATINISEIPAGIYVANIITEQQNSLTKRIVVQRE